MAGVTRVELREAVIFRADLPTSEPRRVSDDQVNTLINRSVRRLQGILQSFHSEDYFKIQTTSTVTSGQPSIALAAAKVIHVMWKIGSSSGEPQYLRLRVQDEDELERRAGLTEVWSKDNPPRWTINLLSSNVPQLWFSPLTAQDEDILVVSQVELSYADDIGTIPFDYAWEEWVVLDCLMAIRQRDKQEAGDIFTERAMVEKAIREQAPERRKDERRGVEDRDSFGDFGQRFPLRVP